MNIEQGMPEGLIFIGLDPSAPPVFFTDESTAASWLAIAPRMRRMWRAELIDITPMEFVPPGEPAIRPREVGR